MATKTKATGNASAQTQQAMPGQYFRWPNIGARSKFIPDSNNQAVNTTLVQGTQIAAATTKLDNLDIVKTLLFVINMTTAWTDTDSKLITSPFFPANAIQQLSVQFESAFNTFRLPGVLAAVMQQVRPALGSNKGLMALNNFGTNVQQGNEPTADWSQPSLLLPTAGGHTSTSLPMLFEVPVAMAFDLYWELDELGNAKGAPVPRAIVSPQYMAANTRTVSPKVTYAPGITTNDLLGGTVSAPSGTSSTFTGTAALEVMRDGWYPAAQTASPPIYGWQYSRDYLTQPTSGQTKVNVPLDQDVTGQGQILMLVGFVWDPASVAYATPAMGGEVPLSSYAEIDLNFSSKLPIYQDTPQTMQYRWLSKHGVLLPRGFFGYDLALTEDGRFTNEEALNTLITAGCQVQLRFNSGSAPSATATVYVGIEILKAVTS
jgi:hypothetical protein